MTTTLTGSRLGFARLAVVTEARAGLRRPEFAVLGMTLPVILYAIFGLPDAGDELPGGTPTGVVMLAGIGCYGALTLGIVVFGEDVAKDRGRGWLRTLAATPVPTGAYQLGKLGAGFVHGLLMVTALCLFAGLVGAVSLTAREWVVLGALLVAGVLAFSPLGFAIAYLARPRAAVVVTNVLFLPLSFVSGLFVPLSELPDVIGQVARWLPSHHFGQVVLHAVADDADIARLTGLGTQPVGVHVAWVLGSAVLFTVVALAAAHREAVTRRG
ncbi:ABC transporter permease [Kineococcus aurantiacus]|uniref:ABC-2 type transport system permease protein n=1 Tax=Kineococcus aurantiacus TaxID=37633 RepID=A0A7Y9J1A3_9ACTN|nr:ABC transporter permease [Kineococcus aurantiacus]NYD22868.1 ABC-2 type transport system permease protein [Kineococcus aurantiacus]